MKKYELAQLQHKANNWDTLTNWVIIPLMILVVMVLCGCVDGPPPIAK